MSSLPEGIRDHGWTKGGSVEIGRIGTVKYKLIQLPPTSISALESAYEIAKKNGLRYVYIGNVLGHIYNSTYCPSCNRKLIHRTNFDVLEMNLVNGKCKFCNSPIQGR